jgi:hypothetical protein
MAGVYLGRSASFYNSVVEQVKVRLHAERERCGQMAAAWCSTVESARDGKLERPVLEL